MRALYTQFSGLIGLLVFLNQLMNDAPLEKTVYVGLCAGLAVYAVLLLGDVTIHKILEQAARMAQATASAPAAEAAGTAEASTGRPTPREKAPDAPPVARAETPKSKATQAA
ncbi:MAG: hypothetical protein D6746_16535 [Bacteroidetes bacterium]|nr:MAG: hypothetical protein D6746_16535 [Bacteroidota bacterium]